LTYQQKNSSLTFEVHISEVNKNSPSRYKVWQMFNRIARRYDLLNHLLSLGCDIYWRRKVIKFIPECPDQNLLDLATGTADQIITILKRCKNVTEAIGMDLAENMIKIAKNKIDKHNLGKKVSIEKGDISDIKYSDNSFDLLTISFGIRNVINVQKALSEMYRVTKAGGRVIILEFSLPKINILKTLYLFYFQKILPFLGSVISGDKFAYRYLNKTVESFPYGKNFCNILTEAGFTSVFEYPLTFGIASIYYGEKLSS